MKPENSSRLTQTDPRLCLILEYMRQRPNHGKSLQRGCLSDVLLAEEKRIQRDPLGTGLLRVSTTDRESKDRALRAICNIEETGNVDKLHASREKTCAENFGLPRSRSASLKELLDRPRQLPYAWKSRLSKTQCHCPRYRRSLMVVHPGIHIEPIQKPMTSLVAQ